MNTPRRPPRAPNTQRPFMLWHERYGRGYAYASLDRARTELACCVPAHEWKIIDRRTGEEIS